MDYNVTIDNGFKRIEEILTFTKGEKLIIVTDSNSRSIVWHDTTTNNRGRLMEDFLASNQLHILNEERKLTTFQSSRVERNIDLNIANNKMLANVQKWDTLEEESASYHNIIIFNTSSHKAEGTLLVDPGQCFRIKEHEYTEFYDKFKHITSETNQIENRGRSYDCLDEDLNQKFKASRDIQDFTVKLEEAI